MKIGIFGDSFSKSGIIKLPGHSYLDYLSWGDIISNNYSNCVKNFGIPGSSLYYSYCEFMTHNQEYDKIIFMITDWGRVFNSKTKNCLLKHVPGFTMAEYYRSTISDPDELAILDAVYNYYIYLQNADEEKLYHQLMIDRIKSVRPDSLLIPCFNNEASLISDYNINMNDISLIDMNAAGLSWMKVRFDPRHCHMNEENNLIFANKIIDWIDNNKFEFDSIDDFVISKKPLSYYFDDVK